MPCVRRSCQLIHSALASAHTPQRASRDIRPIFAIWRSRAPSPTPRASRWARGRSSKPPTRRPAAPGATRLPGLAAPRCCSSAASSLPPVHWDRSGLTTLPEAHGCCGWSWRHPRSSGGRACRLPRRPSRPRGGSTPPQCGGTSSSWLAGWGAAALAWETCGAWCRRPTAARAGRRRVWRRRGPRCSDEP